MSCTRVNETRTQANHVVTAGTKEWADTNVNFIDGCENNCRYCYARKIKARFDQVKISDWSTMKLVESRLTKPIGHRRGRIMFPTVHDLVPRFLTETLYILGRMLAARNSVLVTTKPHLDVITEICTKFAGQKDQIQFRFTITSMDPVKLAYWEPGAPSFPTRMGSLEHAFNRGFKTSISIEPCLDEDPRVLVATLRPFVTESIWLGIMNYCGEHPFNSRKTIIKWLNWFQDDPLIRFKDAVGKKLARENDKIAAKEIESVVLEHSGYVQTTLPIYTMHAEKKKR